MVANILTADPTPVDPGVKMSKLKFSEHSHVAYQIKRNHECSNMVANILPADPTPTTLDIKMSKFNFQNKVMLHIKLKGITNVATW